MNFNEIFNNAKEKVLAFLQGRYGGDTLNNFLLILSSLLLIINIFITNIYVSIVIVLIATGLVTAAAIRTMSRDIYARQNENAAFLTKTAKIRSWLDLQFRKIRDRKTHRYINCKMCKKVLRIKRLTGERTVHCPLCGEYFTTNFKK